jgi:hypothetical protein
MRRSIPLATVRVPCIRNDLELHASPITTSYSHISWKTLSLHTAYSDTLLVAGLGNLRFKWITNAAKNCR